MKGSVSHIIGRFILELLNIVPIYSFFKLYYYITQELNHATHKRYMYIIKNIYN